MKKIIVIIMLVVLAATLFGCGNPGNKATETIYKSDSGASKIIKEVVITSEGDKVSHIKYVTEAPIPEVMFKKLSVDELEKQYSAQYIDPNKKNKGIEYDVSINKDKKTLNVKIDIDTNIADETAVSKIGFETPKEFKKLGENLVEQGYKLQKNK